MPNQRAFVIIQANDLEVFVDNRVRTESGSRLANLQHRRCGGHDARVRQSSGTGREVLSRKRPRFAHSQFRICTRTTIARDARQRSTAAQQEDCATNTTRGGKSTNTRRDDRVAKHIVAVLLGGRLGGREHAHRRLIGKTHGAAHGAGGSRARPCGRGDRRGTSGQSRHGTHGERGKSTGAEQSHSWTECGLGVW